MEEEQRLAIKEPENKEEGRGGRRRSRTRGCVDKKDEKTKEKDERLCMQKMKERKGEAGRLKIVKAEEWERKEDKFFC